jgi:hypothetical protein
MAVLTELPFGVLHYIAFWLHTRDLLALSLSHPCFLSFTQEASLRTVHASEPELSTTLPHTHLIYSPLVLSIRSIRLVRIDPQLSSTGLIQCQMRHSTIDSEYTCLSYVWGQPDIGYEIVINEQLYTVRRNLLDFLRAARKKDLGWLWIDALCIDQANVTERTLQVQLMKSIYSEAIEVVSWLGSATPTVEFLNAHMDNRHLATIFNLNEYWTRAWITQEVLLAQGVILMAGDSELSMELLPDYLQDCGSNFLVRARAAATTPLRGRGITGGRIYSPTLMDPSSEVQNSILWSEDDITNASLLYQLHKFRHQKCVLLRDRVFSLLGLCREGSDLEVDYYITDGELALKILQACERSFCICAIHVVAATFSAIPPGPPASFTIGRFFPLDTFVEIALGKHTSNSSVSFDCFDDNLTWSQSEMVSLHLKWETQADISPPKRLVSIFIGWIRACSEIRLPLILLFTSDQAGFWFTHGNGYHQTFQSIRYCPDSRVAHVVHINQASDHNHLIRLSLDFLLYVISTYRVETTSVGCCMRSRGSEEQTHSRGITRIVDGGNE